MDDQKLVNEEKERATMLETLNRLKEELDRCPERWDWFICTEMQWWKYFENWSEFVLESGILEKLPKYQNKVRHAPVGGVSKMCVVLQTLEKRLGRPATLSDWKNLVNDTLGSNGQKVKSGLQKCANEIPEHPLAYASVGPHSRSPEELWEDFINYAHSPEPQKVEQKKEEAQAKRGRRGPPEKKMDPPKEKEKKKTPPEKKRESTEDLLGSIQEIAAKLAEKGFKIDLTITLL